MTLTARTTSCTYLRKSLTPRMSRPSVKFTLLFSSYTKATQHSTSKTDYCSGLRPPYRPQLPCQMQRPVKSSRISKFKFKTTPELIVRTNNSSSSSCSNCFHDFNILTFKTRFFQFVKMLNILLPKLPLKIMWLYLLPS